MFTPEIRSASITSSGRDSIELHSMRPHGIRSPSPFQAIILMPAVIALLLAMNSCTRSVDADLDLSRLVLHLDYRSGGDAPLGFLMSFFEDGKIRFLSPRWKILWSQLSDVERRYLEHVLLSPNLREIIQRQAEDGPRFACCDAEEVGIFLGAAAMPASVRFGPSPDAPEELIRLVQFVNSVGEAHFGRKFNLPLPEDDVGLAPD